MLLSHRILQQLISLTGLLLLQIQPLAHAATIDELLKTLQRHGFRVEQRHPPKRQAYGQFIAARKLLLISPLATELGVARAVLLHEAVHAAQSCPSGQLRPLGLTLSAAPAVESRIRYLLTHHYAQNQVALEEEAFQVQAQPDAVALIIDALNRRCQAPGG